MTALPWKNQLKEKICRKIRILNFGWDRTFNAWVALAPVPECRWADQNRWKVLRKNVLFQPQEREELSTARDEIEFADWIDVRALNRQEVVNQFTGRDRTRILSVNISIDNVQCGTTRARVKSVVRKWHTVLPYLRMQVIRHVECSRFPTKHSWRK